MAMLSATVGPQAGKASTLQLKLTLRCQSGLNGLSIRTYHTPLKSHKLKKQLHVFKKLDGTRNAKGHQ